jgi:hypothetical protein
MREEHREHERRHDFEAMEALSRDAMQLIMEATMDIGVAVPPKNSRRGRRTFVKEGCTVCHNRDWLIELCRKTGLFQRKARSGIRSPNSALI